MSELSDKSDAPPQAAAAGAAAGKPFSLLCVDDEANILSALRRLFRPLGYQVHTAASGREGLELLGREPVDLVISDMRMPEMNGAEFLEQVRQKWPTIPRLLLTGFADITTTVDAINRAQISRYVTKPWNDEELLRLVQDALERKALIRDKIRLEAQNRKQNEELKQLNANLEAEVKRRTDELRQAMSFLELANDNLKRSFMATVRAFSGLAEMRGGQAGSHALEVGEQARILAIKLGLEPDKVQDVMIAGLLHDIGLIALPDAILEKPFSALNAEERAKYMQHPLKGAEVLAGVEQLHGALEMIRGHHEHFNGNGYPDGISGLEIPLGARIIAVVNDYHDLLSGVLTKQPMRRSEAKAYIQEMSGTRYDPTVVKAFMALLGETAPAADVPEEVQMRVTALRPGMVVARDVIGQDGIMLLSKGYVLNQQVIDQIVQLDKGSAVAKIFVLQ